MTTVAAPVHLGPDDVVAGRAFTHPDHVEPDRAVMYLLARDFHRHLTESGEGPDPVIRHLPGPDDWYRRVVIPRPSEVAGCDRLTVVGFFGRVRDEVDPAVEAEIKALSDRLVDAVLTTPDVLGYSTHLLADERNYANLVIVRGTEVLDRWRSVDPHPRAAADVSPDYYRHVRIYRGAIAGAELCDGTVRLDSVKYWDYRDDPVWHAVRRL
ncbi:MAG: hypothetical protein R3290_01465 [Acidimicrobiia bacterium]|nr:hypothetical protein [Acidimicrobiia bacterium]